MRYIFYGNMEVKYPVRLKKQRPNYSNGSAMIVEKISTKKFEKESKSLKKQLEKRSKKWDIYLMSQVET